MILWGDSLDVVHYSAVEYNSSSVRHWYNWKPLNAISMLSTNVIC